MYKYQRIPGSLVASYTYDGWGNCTVNNISGTIGTINPIRYRSYYYDSETGYYYLNSRYYDSNVGRFINADDTSNLGANDDHNSLNLYAYCANNPVNRYDTQGNIWGVVIGRALFNVVLSWGLAAATNNPFTISDAIGAAFIGGLGAFDKIGNIFAGMIAFGYSVEAAYNKGYNFYTAIVKGFVSGVLTACNFGNFAKFEIGSLAGETVEIVFNTMNSSVDTLATVIADYFLGKKEGTKTNNVKAKSHLNYKNNAKRNVYDNIFHKRYGFA